VIHDLQVSGAAVLVTIGAIGSLRGCSGSPVSSRKWTVRLTATMTRECPASEIAIEQ
jgi:hypothetical protein